MPVLSESDWRIAPVPSRLNTRMPAPSATSNVPCTPAMARAEVLIKNGEPGTGASDPSALSLKPLSKGEFGEAVNTNWAGTWADIGVAVGTGVGVGVGVGVNGNTGGGVGVGTPGGVGVALGVGVGARLPSSLPAS